MPYSPVSVVIICRDSQRTIQQVIEAVTGLTDDIVVVDSGSIDGTLQKIQQTDARLIETEWKGYGPTKSIGNAAAKYDWILSLDADEIPDRTLITAIRNLALKNPQEMYRFKRLNYMGSRAIHFGEWRKDFATRLFNRNSVQWDNSPVHEGFLYTAPVQVKTIPGIIHHYTCTDFNTYKQKLDRYAVLMAEKYAARSKRSDLLKTCFSPVFSFLKNYIFKAGFLDGKAGFRIALANAQYTFNKYRQLRLISQKRERPS